MIIAILEKGLDLKAYIFNWRYWLGFGKVIGFLKGFVGG
jgi:hypothetical protein